MLPIRAGVLAGALLFVGAAPSEQAAPTVTLSCKTVALEALWSGTDSFTCTATPVPQAPSANLKVSCLAPGGMTCEVDPAVVRLSTPPSSSYINVAVRVTYTPALAGGESPLEIRASMGDLPASTTIQVVKNLNTLSSHCPSAEDLQTIDRDFRLVWHSDPTAGTVACRKADGSRDLTVMQARVYRALNTMRHLSFTEPLPWTRDPVDRWLTRTVRGLDFRSDVTNSSCCSADKLINIRAVVTPGPASGQQGFMMAITSSGQMPTDFRMLASFLQLLVHEARHADGKPHTCGPSDQTMEEMGAWAAAHAFQTWIADKMAPGLVPDDVRANLRQQADQICRTRICKGCKPHAPFHMKNEGLLLRHNLSMQLTGGTVVLAHGAGAGKDHPWMLRVVRAFASHGIEARTFNFPYIDAGRSAPDRAPVLEAHYAKVWKDLTRGATPPFFATGKSMGGRIASQVAAQNGFDPAPAGLIFFGYPLHPPNQPNKRRDEHLPKIAAPLLFLHGTRDPFGTPDEMQALTAGLPGATLHLIDGGDHSLVVKRKDGADSVERAVAVAADWITRR